MAKTHRGDLNVTRDLGVAQRLQMPGITTVARDLLTAVEGDRVYNSDNARMEWYDGAAWGPESLAGTIAEIVADPAPAASGIRYLATYGAAGALTLPAYGTEAAGALIELVNLDGSVITITPQAGELLNGVADQTYIADSVDAVYRVEFDGTDWTVTRNSIGGGEATSNYSMRGALTTYNPAAGIDVLPIGTAVDSDTVGGATFPLAEIDDDGWRTGNVLTVPVGKGGRYDFSGMVNHPDETLGGGGASGISFGHAGFRINSGLTQWLDIDTGGSIQDQYHWRTLIDLADGDTIELMIETDGSGTLEDFAFNVVLVPVPTTVNVDPALVIPTTLQRLTANNAVVSNNGADAYVLWDTVENSVGSLAQVLGTTGLVTLEAGKTYELSAGSRAEPGVSGYQTRYFRTSGGVTIGQQWTTESMSNATDNTGQSGYSTIYTPGADTDVGVYILAGSTLHENNPGSFFNVVELPSSTIVDPDLVTPVTLHQARVRRAVAQSIVISVETQIAFDTLEYDTGGIVSLITGAATITQPGKYIVNAGWANTVGSNNVQTQIKVDGVNITRGGDAKTSGGGILFSSATATLDLAIGQVVTIDAFTDQATQYTSTVLEDQPFFEIIQVPDSTVVQPTTVDYLTVVNAYTKQQYIAETLIPSGANIAWNLDDEPNASTLLSASGQLDNPTNQQAGGTYVIRVVQDGTGTRVLTYDTAYLWPGGSAPTLSTAANAVDILTFYSDGTNMYGVESIGFA